MSKRRWFASSVVLIAAAAYGIRAYMLRATLPQHILDSNDLFKGKTTLITGATDGIGLATSIQLHKMGSNLIIGARNPEKAREKIKLIRSSRNDNVEPTIHFIPLDLSSLESTREFAAQVKDLDVKIDYIVNNAGAYFSTFGLTNDGYEQSWQINHLSHFLLTTILLGRLNKNARIINLSSDAHFRANNYQPLTLEQVRDDMSNSTYKSFFGTYGLSKMCNILFSTELQKRVPDDVTVVSVHPGYVQTPMARDAFSIVGPLVYAFESWLAKTPLQGAYTTIYAMTSNEIEKGGYYSDCAKATPSPASQNDEFAKKLWELSEQCIKQ
ncbi:WW domain-containing oxidoreductase [Acrasis kona]|uniref:WW domain-containing oxidoreductase n=1 Tax=Acrasis kona TaxID=1008807 RepID=A0AAW2Z6T8_9EUKA